MDESTYSPASAPPGYHQVMENMNNDLQQYVYDQPPYQQKSLPQIQQQMPPPIINESG